MIRTSALLLLLAGGSQLLLGCAQLPFKGAFKGAFNAAEPERVIPEGGGVTEALNNYLRQNSIAQDNSFVVDYVDLNNDQVEEGLVLMQGADWCSISGCTLLVFRGLPGGYFEFVSAIDQLREPIKISDERTSGWRDLIVATQIKQRPQDVQLRFDGQRYPESAIAGVVLPGLAEIPGENAF